MENLYKKAFDAIKPNEQKKQETILKIINYKKSVPSDKKKTTQTDKGKKMRKLWKPKHIAIAASVAAVVIFCAVFIPLVLLNGGRGTKTVPQYLSMTVSQANANAQQVRLLSAITVDPITDVPAEEEIFYAVVNQDAYVYINLNNPDNFEILSFTLNGYKYQSFEFEYGSTGQRLILKRNAGSVTGIMNYTLDEIKYIDGTEIKDAEIKGNKTVKVNVLGWMNVTYHANGGEGGENMQVVDGQKAIPSGVFRQGYSFKGWYTSEECTEQYDFDRPVTQNIELWAKWTVTPIINFETTLPSAKRLLSYSVSVGGKTADESKMVYSLKSGNLPEGLTLSADGRISGIVAEGLKGKYEFVVLVTCTESGDTDEGRFSVYCYNEGEPDNDAGFIDVC